MKRLINPLHLLYLILFCGIANGYLLFREIPALWLAAGAAFVWINLFAGLGREKLSLRLRVCRHGAVSLCVFVASLPVSAVYHGVLAFRTIPDSWQTLLWSLAVCFAACFVLFWNGMICLYVTSYQLGIKWRVIGALCGLIPVVNLVVLGKMLRVVADEIVFETDKERTDVARRDQRLCDTRYPILLVHGVFFRDYKYFNYWGRIPKALEKNGARIFYGEQPSAKSVADNAAFLAERIREIAQQNGGKVNIIAHSKGGLDCRYAISELGAAPFVASLTTVNTPHKGCRFADYLLEKAPDSLKQSVADAYNKTLEKLGDESPDFLAAVGDLTEEACEKRNELLRMPEGIVCQSVGSVMGKAKGGQFPLNLSYHVAYLFDGDNDGLVSERSFAFGESYCLIRVSGGRGVSHGDMIDLNRENLPEFDVREFYVETVNGLKNRGL